MLPLFLIMKVFMSSSMICQFDVMEIMLNPKVISVKRFLTFVLLQEGITLCHTFQIHCRFCDPT